jgi:hypothetical protein
MITRKKFKTLDRARHVTVEIMNDRLTITVQKICATSSHFFRFLRVSRTCKRRNVVVVSAALLSANYLKRSSLSAVQKNVTSICNSSSEQVTTVMYAF